MLALLLSADGGTNPDIYTLLQVCVSQLLTSTSALCIVSSKDKEQQAHLCTQIYKFALDEANKTNEPPAFQWKQRKFAQMSIKKTVCDVSLFPVTSCVCSVVPVKKEQSERSLPFLVPTAKDIHHQCCQHNNLACRMAV